jgi:DNA primase
MTPARGCILADDRAALTQQIKEANDIVDVVGGYVSLRPAGPTFKGLCPFHDDKRPSFDVDPRRQRYKCWSCGKSGDVFNFIMEMDKVSFPEAQELLARRAGITLEKFKKSTHNPTRALMLDVMKWAAAQFQECLLNDYESPAAAKAREYLGERKLTGETVRKFGLGFAPPGWDWLVGKASKAGHSFDLLEQVGLVAKKNEGNGYYDRFRERVIFPIRDLRGQTVGFGGRVLPGSASEERGPKYYNSAETMLFSKSQQLYGIDHARDAASKAGWLAVVEGYTDVLMAHQKGVANVVATMGTALNERHVQQLRRVVPKVILVFDADAGGEGGVDRALEVFVRNEMDLQVATLPEGLDPCDLLVRDGPEPFKSALTKAVDVLEFKLNRVWAREVHNGVEGQRRAVDLVLGILAQAPETRTVKLELMINRIAHRLGLKEETVWARLEQVRANRRATDRRPVGQAFQPTDEEQTGMSAPQEVPAAKAAAHEVELLEALLAEPALVPAAQAEVPADQIEHPGLRLLVEGLYRLQAEGVTPDLDHLRVRIDKPRLLDKALELQDRGLAKTDRQAFLSDVLARFRHKRAKHAKQIIYSQLQGVNDHATAVELLKRLQDHTG